MTGIDSSSEPILIPGPFSSVLVVCMGAGFRYTRGQVSEEDRGVRFSGVTDSFEPPRMGVGS